MDREKDNWTYRSLIRKNLHWERTSFGHNISVSYPQMHIKPSDESKRKRKRPAGIKPTTSRLNGRTLPLCYNLSYLGHTVGTTMSSLSSIGLIKCRIISGPSPNSETTWTYVEDEKPYWESQRWQIKKFQEVQLSGLVAFTSAIFCNWLHQLPWISNP